MTCFNGIYPPLFEFASSIKMEPTSFKVEIHAKQQDERVCVERVRNNLVS